MMGTHWIPQRGGKGHSYIFEDEKGCLQILVFASPSSFNYLSKLGSSFQEKLGLTIMVCASIICSSCIWLLGNLIVEKAAVAAIHGSLLEYKLHTGS